MSVLTGLLSVAETVPRPATQDPLQGAQTPTIAPLAPLAAIARSVAALS